MKKLLFGAYSLDIGGIEKALVILVNKLQEKGYDITLVLEKRQGIFLNEINPKIKIIEYEPSNSKNKIQRKIINLIKRIKFTLKYKNKYDFSASFATYSLPASFVARTASKNCYLWGHADYLTLFDGNTEKMKEFFIEKNYDKFKKIIFVSKEGKDSFIKVFPEMKEKTMVCNNLIDADKRLELSKEKISEEDLLKINKLENTQKETTTFINVGRHQEKQKKLSRLIEASTMLKKDNMNFKIIFIGDGPETEEYKNYLNTKRALCDNIDLCNRLKEFRARNYELQNRQGVNPFDEVNDLVREYDEVLQNSVVSEFLRAEQKICKMMQRVYNSISEGLEFDYLK